MPDIKQSLRDFVATSNSGKYSDEKVLLSKFPELSGYDINSLKDFVATSNSGKYADENELLSKFPEFKTGAQPKAVQPPAKKKSLESPSAWEGIMSSLVPSVKEEQQPAVSSSEKKAEIPQAVDIAKLNSDIKRDKTKDGLYTFPDQETAVYKKQNGQWLVDVNKSGNFQPLTKGDVEARSKNLDAKAIPLGTTQGPGYEERITYLAKEKAKEKLPATATEEDFNKEVSKNKLIERQTRLKDLGYDVDINGDATDKKTIDAFNKYSQYVDFKKESDVKRGAFMQKVDKSLDLNLINQTEESAVKYLRDKFQKDGFVFKETGIGDAMTVQYSLGSFMYSDPITIDLQTINSNPEELEKLKSFIKNKYVSGAEKDVILENSKKKLGEVKDNDAYEKRYYKETIKLLAQNPSKFGEKLIDEGQYNNYMDSQYEDLRGTTNDIKDFEFNIKKQVQDFELNPTKEKEISINNNINELNVLKNNVKKSTEDLVSMEKNYYKALGKWSEAKEKQGNFFGSLAASAASGFTSGEKALMNVATDLIVTFAPNAGMAESEYRRLIDNGYTDQEIKSKTSSEIKRTIVKDVSEGITNIASLGSTTNEYIKSKDRSFLENVVTGLAESVGASVSGGGNKTMQGLAFFAQSYNTMQDQMSGKEFDGMSVWEKSALSSIYGIAIGQLEKLGFDQASNITKNSLVDKLIKNTIAKTIPKLPKNASMPAIEEAVSQSLGKTIAESGIRIVAGGLSEGGVEGIQSVTEDVFKSVVNNIHDKELFQDVPDLSTKEGWKKSLGAAMEDAAAGAVGGMIMSSYDSFTTKRGNAKSDGRFELMRQSLMNETTLKAVQMKAKMDLENGTINKEQYDKKIEGMNNTISTLEKIPEGYTVREKRKAFELINQKNVIEKGIEGKDPLLVTKEKKQIAEIDAQLVALSEADRVKEEPIDIMADLQEDFDAELENNGISPEMVEMNNELNKKENATKEGNITESNLTERENGNEVGEEKRPSDSYSTVESGENQKEVEKLRADEQAELSEAIPNIDEYKVDGKIDKKKIKASEDGAKYQEIYDKYDKLITPLLPKKENVVVRDEKLKKQVSDARNEDSFIRDIITDFDVRYKNRKDAEFLTEIEPTSVIDANKPKQDIDSTVVKSWEERIDKGERPPIIIRENGEIDGHHKLKAYKNLQFDEVPVIYEKDLRKFYKDNKEQPTEQPTVKTEEQPITETTENESINKKIDETESKQESEVKSTGANIETAKAKKAKSIPRTSQALDVETTNLEHIVYKYFIRGGKIDVAKTAQSLFGTKSSMSTRSIKSEYQKRIGLHKKNAPTIGKLARDLWEENQDQFGESITDQDWRNAVEAVFNSHNGTKRMIEELLAIDVNATVDAEYKYWEDNYGEDLTKEYDDSELMDAESVLDNMTDEEIIQLSQEIEASEKESVEKAEQPTTLKEAESLDTSDPTSLKRLDDYLAKLEKDLRDFGKETLGMNLGVAAALKAIQGIRALVSATVGFAEALKKYAEKNNLSEIDIVDSIEALNNKQKESEASKAAKNISKKDNTKVTVTERVALKDQLRMEAKAARESAMNIKKKQRALIDSVKAMEGAGKITPSQSSNLLRKLAYLNVDNVDTTQDFLDYAERLFANAEYSDKVDKAFKAKAKIKAKLKSKNQAPVTQVAKEFATIDPSLVTDIDKYNEMADAMLAAIAPSVSGVKKNEEGEYEANNKLKTPINIADVQSYVEKALEAQKEIEKQRLLSYYKELVEAGIINDKMSIEEIREVVANENNDEDKLTAKERAKIVMDDLKERFAVAKSAIEDILSGKKNNDTIIERDEYIDGFDDNESYVFLYDSKEQIPEIFRDSPVSGGETITKKSIFGKKEIFQQYKVVITGKEIKKKFYSSEEQATDDSISESDREIIKRLMSLDITDMKIKDAMALVDAANNFIENGITAGLMGELPKHEGDAVVKKLKKSGLVAKSIGFLRGFGTKMKTIGSVYATQVLNPRMMANTLFGQDRGIEFMRLIGFDKLSSGVSKASERAKDRFKEYSKQFTKKRPNDKRFSSPFNRYERGIYASLLRSPIGTEFEQKKAFNTAVDEALLSTKKLLESGDSAKVRKGKIYQEIIDKLGLANEDVSIKSVQSKVDPTNLEAVDFWIQTWNDYYGDLYDLSLGVYNTILDRDSNYTPTRKSKIDISVKDKDSDLLKNEGAFASFMNLGVNKNKAGVLMEKSRVLSGQNTYQDYDFDGNNKEGFEAALMDIYTAEAIRKIEGALNSDAMKSIIPVTDTRERFKEKLERYINIKKGRREPQDRDVKNIERTIAVIAKFVTGRTLGTISAMPAQFIAPAMTTLFNTGRLDFSDALNPDARAWAKNEGVSTLMRGQENFDSINRRNEQSILDAFDKNGNFDAALTAIEKYYDFWLKNFLVVADRGIGNISWYSYYKQSLKRQGLSTNIDWKNHKKNDKAFAYANSMIDKNQNASDSDMQGNLYSSKKAGVRITRNIFIPYSSFTMNAKARMHTDLVNMINYEDNGAQGIIDSIRSLVAGFLEIATFHTVKKSIQIFVLNEIASLIFGIGDDEEDYLEMMQRIIKEGYASVIKDVFSPAPIADYYTMEGVNYYIEQATESELTENDDSKIKDAYEKDKESRILKGDKETSYDDFKKKYIKEQVSENKFFNPSEDLAGGVISQGIKIQKQLADLYNLGYNKKISVKDYKGEYVGDKVVTDNVAEAGKRAFYLTLAHEAGILPGEASSISRMILKKAKATAETPNIKKVADDFKKDLGLKELTQYQKDMIKSGTNLDKMIENEYEIVKGGGLDTPKKQESFNKIKETFGNNIDVFLIVRDINNNKSTKEIIESTKKKIFKYKGYDEKIESRVAKYEEKYKEKMIEEIKNSRK